MYSDCNANNACRDLRDDDIVNARRRIVVSSNAADGMASPAIQCRNNVTYALSPMSIRNAQTASVITTTSLSSPFHGSVKLARTIAPLCVFGKWRLLAPVKRNRQHDADMPNHRDVVTHLCGNIRRAGSFCVNNAII